MKPHTPVPWQYDINGTQAAVVTPDGDLVFNVSVLQHSTQLSDLEGNLSLLTRAVNQHRQRDKLLAVLGDVYAIYGRLHDTLSDCIERGRLHDVVPDDYQALVEQLAACVGVDHQVEQAIKGASDPFTVAYTVGVDEHATILAALRFYQEHDQGEPLNRTSDLIHELASGERGASAGFDSLDEAGIEKLFQRLYRITAEPDDAGVRPYEHDEGDTA